MKEDQIRELFREMREEPVPADSQARVRMEAARRIADGRKVWSWWRWGAVAAAAACAVLVVVMVKQRPQVPPAPSVASIKLVPVTPPVAAAPAEPRTRTRKARPEVMARIERQAVRPRVTDSNMSNVVIRIETPDPNVVILLIGDE
jgi:hypothetical protein